MSFIGGGNANLKKTIGKKKQMWKYKLQTVI